MFGVAIYGVLVLIGFVTLVVFGILIYFLYRRFEEQDYLLEEL
jgi:heme/copper-type cytochrome/quinol oxidase subunit 2